MWGWLLAGLMAWNADDQRVIARNGRQRTPRWPKTGRCQCWNNGACDEGYTCPSPPIEDGYGCAMYRAPIAASTPIPVLEEATSCRP